MAKPHTDEIRRSNFLPALAAHNKQHGGASREETARIARDCGYPSGRSVCYMFRHGWLVTRDDGRWVTGRDLPGWTL